MESVTELRIADYTYDLPKERIAFEPLEKRDASKLLIWENQRIIDEQFINLTTYLNSSDLIVFNKTKVIPARLIFYKKSGAKIEILLLEPTVSGDYEKSLNSKGTVIWKCMIGGLSKLKGELLEKSFEFNGTNVILSATVIQEENSTINIAFTWEPSGIPFIEILEASALMPLPPYIKREANEKDKLSYQTIYGEEKGSVAAPTAGLHFTENVMNALEGNGVERSFVTLHVGAGTFKPVKAERMSGHNMHSEYIEVELSFLKKILNGKKMIAVGTTTTRTLESIYWMGVKTIINNNISVEDLQISQWEVYNSELKGREVSKEDALKNLIGWMERKDISKLISQTQILIAPGYKFRMIDKLITNFHQPNSTLLLLIAAAVGNAWKEIYTHALENKYRFLSYGDSSMLEVIN